MYFYLQFDKHKYKVYMWSIRISLLLLLTRLVN